MDQDMLPDAPPIEFTFPTWHSDTESWDDFLSAVEEAYAQFRVRCWQRAVLSQAAPHPDAEEQPG